MKVITVPKRLKAAIGLLAFCVPLISLEVVISTRSPYWNLPTRSMSYWTLSFLLIYIPISAWLALAKKWAFALTLVLSCLWILASAWAAATARLPSLGFFTAFLLAYLFVCLSWIRIELSRSFFNPNLAWYQSLPKAIPALQCQISLGEKTLDLKVSQMDRDGLFLFTDTKETKMISLLTALTDRRKVDMTLYFREFQVRCEGRPILSISNHTGLGIQFFNNSSDLRKEIVDFVEILRGHGYV